MTRGEAEAYLREFLGENGARHERLTASWVPAGCALRLIDDVARYLSEVVRRTVPHACWSVARAKAKGYVDQNWPALTVGTTYLNPVLLVLNAALAALHELPTNGPDRLRQVYEANTRLARKP